MDYHSMEAPKFNNESNEELNKESFTWGIKMPKQILKEGQIDAISLDETINTLASKGINSIEIPHNLQKPLRQNEMEAIISAKSTHPDLHITIHENIDNPWPYDKKEYDEDQRFTPQYRSQWAREQNKNDIASMVESAKDVINQAAFIQADVITIHPIGAYHGYAPKEFVEYDRLYFTEIAKYLEQFNSGRKKPIKVSIENFVFPYAQSSMADESGQPPFVGQATDFATPNLLETQIQLVKDIDCPYLGFTLDTGHAFWSESSRIQNILDTIDSLSSLDPPRIFHIHLHDTTTGADRHMAPGSGEIDFRPILDKLHQTNFQGIIEIEVSDLDKALEGKEYLDQLTQ